MSLCGWRAALVLAGVALGSGMAAAQDSVTIPLNPNADRSGFANLVTVSVGGGPPSEVLVDTGSSGLRFLQSEIGPDLMMTDTTISYPYASGNYVTGVLGYAPVSFPDASTPVSTTDWIAIEVVTSVTCQPDKPDCPGWPTGQSGVMGVDYDNNKIFNRLAQL